LYDIAPGAMLAGRYKVIGPHRQGGLSTAIEVEDTSGGARCELQLFPPGLFESDEQKREFLGLLEPWREVTSDTVLGLKDLLDLEPATLGLVTAYPEGESLRQVLNREECLPVKSTVNLGVQILEGLEAIHGRSLVHGDVKPYTIHLVDFSEGNAGDDSSVPRVLLVDGGLTPGLWTAKDLGDKTALIGTPYYAPVEQFGGDAPDVLSDVYNVATVLYECLTGVLPWRGKTFLQVFQSKLEAGPPPMGPGAKGAQVPALLEEIIARGCRAKRDERWQSAADFRAALEALA
ncbi:MAG: serine/threonine protein kinase, partial [Planctomycetota bacterium]